MKKIEPKSDNSSIYAGWLLGNHAFVLTCNAHSCARARARSLSPASQQRRLYARAFYSVFVVVGGVLYIVVWFGLV